MLSGDCTSSGCEGTRPRPLPLVVAVVENADVGRTTDDRVQLAGDTAGTT
jgi:hypothetical protein